MTLFPECHLLHFDLIYVICGLLIGLTMGLTGAGGALIAIPLFMQFLGMSLKEASTYSLLGVVVASFSNFISQRSSARCKTAALMVVFSSLGSWMVTPFKKMLPDFMVATLIIILSLGAIYNVWSESSSKQRFTFVSRAQSVFSGFIGVSLGALTTLTGLGGGAILVPVLLKVYFFSQAEAISTSLLIVSVSSFISLAIQVYHGAHVPWDLNLVRLIVGIVGAAVLVKFMLNTVSNRVVLQTRKLVFSLVVILAILRIIVGL